MNQSSAGCTIGKSTKSKPTKVPTQTERQYPQSNKECMKLNTLFSRLLKNHLRTGENISDFDSTSTKPSVIITAIINIIVILIL
jgi:hypothetical protein